MKFLKQSKYCDVVSSIIHHAKRQLHVPQHRIVSMQRVFPNSVSLLNSLILLVTKTATEVETHDVNCAYKGAISISISVILGDALAGFARMTTAEIDTGAKF
jgi:hypothetical protein